MKSLLPLFLLFAFNANANEVMITKQVEPITVGASALPAGAATATLQTTGNSSLSSIDGKVSTAAKQDTAQVTLDNIKTKLSIASAFGEWLVAEISPQFQLTCDVTVLNTDINDNFIVGTGTVSQGSGMCTSATGATAGSTARLQSGHHARYRAGLGLVMRQSLKLPTPIAGTKVFMGLMDEPGSVADFKNGYAIGYNGTTLEIARWQNDAVFEVPRSSWDDKLDGTGASGVTITFTNLNVFYIQAQYLGAGNINFWIEHPTTGIPFIFHSIRYANTAVVPSTYNPNYHAILWASNGAVASNISISTASFGVFVEGLTEYHEIYQPQNSSTTKQKLAVTTEIAIFSIRNKATFPTLLPKANYTDLVLERFSASIEANAANNLGTCRLVKNTTLGGVPVWADINGSNSVVEIDVAGTTITGGKELLATELANKNDRNNENIIPFHIFIHPGETVTIACSSANSATFRSSLLWKELM